MNKLIATLACLSMVACLSPPTPPIEPPAPSPTLTPTPAPTQPGGVAEIPPRYGLEGLYRLEAQPSYQGGTLRWQLDREEISERDPDRRTLTRVDECECHVFDVQLTKTAGQQTRYHFTAWDQGFKAQFSVQVFPANQTVVMHYQSEDNPDIPVYIHVPATLSGDSRLISIHHGASRNADDYIERFSYWSEQQDYIAIAPEFSKDDWSGSLRYNLGYMFTDSDPYDARERDEDRWSYTLAVDIAKDIMEGFSLNHQRYDAWGHSAGGQFVHRLMIFKPEAPIRFGMPANPGWWTEPSNEVLWPYGLLHPLLHIGQQQIHQWSEQQMIIFRGTEDTLRDSSLRQTPEADAQGLNRYLRAGYMFEKGLNLNANSQWQLIDVPGVGHDGAAMAPAAHQFLQSQPRVTSNGLSAP